MASLQYGGSVGFTSDFSDEPVSPSAIPIIWVRVGNSSFFAGLEFIQAWVTSVGSIGAARRAPLQPVPQILGTASPMLCDDELGASDRDSEVGHAGSNDGPVDVSSGTATDHEVSWTSATEDSVSHVFNRKRHDPGQGGRLDGLQLSALPLYHGTQNKWKWIGFAPRSYASSIYVLSANGFLLAGTDRSTARQAPIRSVPRPGAADHSRQARTRQARPYDRRRLDVYSANMNTVTAGTFFSPPGPGERLECRCSSGRGELGRDVYASIDTRQFLIGHRRGSSTTRWPSRRLPWGSRV